MNRYIHKQIGPKLSIDKKQLNLLFEGFKHKIAQQHVKNWDLREVSVLLYMKNNFDVKEEIGAELFNEMFLKLLESES